MSKQKEGSFQERVQRYIEQRGGYCKKNWGNMTSKPGVGDITVCYKGIYIVLECKVDNNKPSRYQGIHCRLVRKAGGLTAIVWHLYEVELIFNIIDELIDDSIITLVNELNDLFTLKGIDSGTEY